MHAIFSRLLYLCLGVCLPLQAQTYRIGVEAQPYMPYSDVVDGQYQGFGRALLDAFAAHQGYQFDYRPLPVRRLLNELLQGRVDFKYPDNPRWNAEQKVGYRVHVSQPAVPAIDGVLVKPDNLNKGIAALRRLGTQRGFTPWPYLEQIKAGRITLVQANKIDSLLAMALNDRVDGVYLNPQVVAHSLLSSGQTRDALVFDRSLDYMDDHYFLSSIKYPQVIVEFNRFLNTQAAQVKALKLEYGITD